MAQLCRACETWDVDAARRWWEMHLQELTGPLTLTEAGDDARQSRLAIH
jgi:hypothetical protein